VTSVVLDASALMAVANAEPGADVVRAVLQGASISAVNFSEVLKKAIERETPVDPLFGLIKASSLVIVPFDEGHARTSAELYPQTKERGLSFADRACLSLALMRDAYVLTAERQWPLLKLPIKIKLIRNAH
jgi:ribonuclease VapC